MNSPESSVSFRIRREVGGIAGFARKAWGRWWVKVLAVLGVLLAIAWAVFWYIFASDLPSVDKLRTYEPPLPTNVRGIDGLPIHSYARERRVELSFEEYPPLLIRAFLAAEDKSFFEHHGVDYPGMAGAVVDYITKMGSGRRAKGGSTITQQVAKNLLIGNTYSPTRKIKEALLAYRIEDTLTKQQILELYLNQIALGRNAFGVAAASDAYFGKDLNQLDLAQFAYLAILPKGPSNYDPVRHPDRALARRKYVLDEMLKNSFIDQAQHDSAMAEPLGTVPRQTPRNEVVGGGYFVEEVRRQLIDKFGEDERAGPYSVYSGGLWVRTSLDPKLQEYAQTALRDGLIRYDRGHGWSGPMRHVEITGANWLPPLLNTNISLDYQDWRAALVVAIDGANATLGFANGQTGTLPRYAAQMPVRGKGGNAFDALKVGDVIAVAPEGGNFALRAIPKISGAFVVEEPQTGRVLAMQGGFDASVQSFNRATQAERQPGSTIKPIVYAAALEQGLTPATIIMDAPFCFYQGAKLGSQPVPAVDRLDGLGTQRVAQPTHTALHHLGAGGRRVLTPQRLRQHLGIDTLTGPQRQSRDDDPVTGPERLIRAVDLERTKHPQSAHLSIVEGPRNGVNPTDTSLIPLRRIADTRRTQARRTSPATGLVQSEGHHHEHEEQQDPHHHRRCGRPVGPDRNRPSRRSRGPGLEQPLHDAQPPRAALPPLQGGRRQLGRDQRTPAARVHLLQVSGRARRPGMARAPGARKGPTRRERPRPLHSHPRKAVDRLARTDVSAPPPRSYWVCPYCCSPRGSLGLSAPCLMIRLVAGVVEGRLGGVGAARTGGIPEVFWRGGLLR